MGSLLRGIPAAVFLATALLLIPAGILLPWAAAANNGPNAGQVSPGWLVFGFAMVIGGIALMWVAWGVWRSKIWRTRLALPFSIAALFYLVAALPRSLTPIAFAFDEAGRAEPLYDGRAGPVVLAIVLYVIALVCLVVAERRQSTAARNQERPPGLG
jgi:hypothetical protein